MARGLGYNRGTLRAYPARNASLARFGVLSALVLGLILGLVWAMALRENASRRLDLEFSAFRTSTRLMEEYLQDPTKIETDQGVLGLGIYSPDGSPLHRQGRAPASFLAPRPTPTSFSLQDGGASVILVRPLGLDEGQSPPMPMMRRGGMGPGGGMGLGSGPRPGRGQARILWLEFSSDSMSRANLLTLGASCLISLGLAILYLVLMRLYRRNLELREREAGNRELVQLGEAARTLAHEIKNPLAIIRIQTASLRRLGETGRLDPPGLGERTLVIEEEVDRLTALSDRIREFLRSGEGEAVDLDLGPFLSAFAARYAAAEDFPSLVAPKGAEGLWVHVDPDRLSQALDNVVRNALEASSAAGKNGAIPPVRLSVAQRGSLVEICVDDEGPGIAPELEARLFEPFFTTKEKGSGIGLALARRIAMSAGGSLEHRRRSGPGACFVLCLPRVPAPSPKAG